MLFFAIYCIINYMSDIDDLTFEPGPAEDRLAAELERFSFGVAASPLAEVDPIEGPDKFVRTIVNLGGTCIDHAQHPETKQQNITVTGLGISKVIADKKFVFDTEGKMLMPGFGPPASPEVTEELASAIRSVNTDFEALSKS